MFVGVGYLQQTVHKKEVAMGRILTCSQLSRGAVPRVTNFRPALTLVRERCSGFWVESAQLFGSAAYGAYGPRSDIDVIIIGKEPTNPAHLRGYVACLVDDVMKNYAVPLSVQLVTEKQLETGSHTLIGPLARHLRRVAAFEGAKIKGDVCGRLPPPEITTAEVRDYVVRKFCKIQTMLTNPDRMLDSQLCRLLQKVVEAPLHVARRQLDLIGGLNEDDCSAVVIERYRATMPDELVQAFLAAHGANSFYDAQVVTHTQKFNKEGYQNVLKNLYVEYVDKTLSYLELVMKDLARS
jgi:predicted nucleotidyltransferase